MRNSARAAQSEAGAIIMVMGRPVPSLPERALAFFCHRLAERICPLLDGKERDRLEGMAADKSSLRYYAARLLAHSLAGSLAKQMPNASFSFSHDPGMVFCAACATGEVAIDVEPVPDAGNAKAFAAFFRRIWPEFPGDRFSAQGLARIWTICEATLKLEGTGWDGNAREKLRDLDFFARKGELRRGTRRIGWLALPLSGRWFCVAACGVLSAANIKFAQALPPGGIKPCLISIS